jgi:hypothetical protein
MLLVRDNSLEIDVMVVKGTRVWSRSSVYSSKKQTWYRTLYYICIDQAQY